MPAVKDVGEPCEGEPHARFDGGREETNASRPKPRGARRLPPTRPLSPGSLKPRARACEELMVRSWMGTGPKPFLYFRFVCKVTVLVCLSPPPVPVTVSV
jgi:hypothetical protein